MMKSVGISFVALMFLVFSVSSLQTAEKGTVDELTRVRNILEQARHAAAAIRDGIQKTQALGDIALVQARAGDPAGAKRILQEALHSTSTLKFGKERANGIIAMAQAETGDIIGALETAATIEENPHSTVPFKAIAFEAIALAQAKAGDILGAVQTANGIKDIPRRSLILDAVAVRLAEAGEIPGALHIMASIQNDFIKSRVLSAVGAAQVKAGDKAAADATFQQALQSANAMQNPHAKAHALGHIAISRAHAGDVPEALKLASTLPDDSWKADVLGTIAVAQTTAGDLAGAFKTMPMIAKDYWQPQALRGVAVAQAEAGDVPGALKTISLIRFDNYQKALALSGIALAQAKAGDYANAITTFQRAVETSDPSRGPYDIVENQTRAAAQAEVGDVVGPLEIAATIQDEQHKTSILEAIAVTRAEAGYMLRALQTAATLQSNLYKSRAFSVIAVAQAKAGDKAAADATFQQALLAANAIQNSYVKAHAFGRIAISQAEAGDVLKALELAPTLPDNYWKADVLGTIAVAQTKAGDVTGALQTVAIISKGGWQAKALREISVAQAEAGDVQGALKTVAMIQSHNYEKTRAFAWIAEAWKRAGDHAAARTTFQQALQLAEKSSRDRSPALHSVGVAQIKAGDHSAPKNTLQKALKTSPNHDEVWNAAILKDIALAQAKAGDIVAALKTAARIPDVTAAPRQPRFKLSALEGIAEAQVDAGDTQGAFQTAAIMRNNSEKAVIFRGIANAQARSGDFRGALKTAGGIQNNGRKADALTAIAMAQVKSGDLRGALLTTLIIRSGPRSALILRNVAKTQGRSGAVPDDFVWFIDQCPPFLRSSALLGWAEGILEQTTGQKAQSTLSSLRARIWDVQEPASLDPWLLEERSEAVADVQRTIGREHRKIKTSRALPSAWEKVSDNQIARLFFPDEKLYFQPDLKGIPMEDVSIIGEGVVVHKVKRVVANFDNHPEDEIAVLINYSTGMCTSCVDNAIFAIVGKRDGKLKILWKKEAWVSDNDGISKVKLINKDKFFELAFTFDAVPITGRSEKKISFIRWNGKSFVEIWGYRIQSQDDGGHDGVRHDYLAKVNFLEDKERSKGINVTSIYRAPPYNEERLQYVRYEAFAWSEKTQMYFLVRQDKFGDLIELFDELKAPPNLIEDLREARGKKGDWQ